MKIAILVVAAVLNGVPIAALAAEPSPGYDAFIAEASQRFGIPEAWIRAVIGAESANNPRALSRKGAMGLMQLMPGTWLYWRGAYGLGTDPFESRDNILAGTAYMRELYDRYGAPGFLAAYNAGPGRYEDSLTSAHPLPAETLAYVAKLGSQIAQTAPWTAPVPIRVKNLTWSEAPLFEKPSTDAESTQPGSFETMDTPFVFRSETLEHEAKVDTEWSAVGLKEAGGVKAR